jgi:hypothetical protein
LYFELKVCTVREEVEVQVKRRRLLGPVGVSLVVASRLFLTSAAAQTSTSAPLAQKLSAFMEANRVQALAARDPATANRYVAALFYPGSQLLVVAGSPTVATLAQQQFERGEYAALYSTLHQSVAADSKLFVQDMNADGLRAKERDSTDIVYDRVVYQMLFDGNPGKRRQTDQAYEREFVEADASYSQLLRILLTAAMPAETSSTRSVQ